MVLGRFVKKPFGSYRMQALNKWRFETKRTQEIRRKGIVIYSQSAFMNAFECKWQELYASKTHNSLFCSMGDFSTNIDDLLTDKRLDEVNTNNLDEIHASALFRYYVRILLVTEQIIEDFVKLKSPLPNDAKDLKGFINNVIKHRVSGRNKFHKCNHHIDIEFHDFTKKRVPSKDSLNVQNYDSLNVQNYNVKKTDYDCVVIPKLSFVIATIIKCYKLMDDELADNPDFTAKIRSEYNQ